ncbi:MAG: GNAT family N-acetyltransferase [Oscillospiraceae bacterium]|nr:GNAT family N-acetyltransferase [Oscillospiraceae bacterium]
MIKQITKENIPECVKVIRESFLTVAEEFSITPENAPRFTAFAVTDDRLYWHFDSEHRPMSAYFEDGKIVGYYSLFIVGDSVCELNNLCTLPAYRHNNIGEKLLEDAFEQSKKLGCTKMQLSFVEENKRLRKWYENHGFIHTGTEKLDFFPFTCGYMEIDLQ